MDYVWIVLYSIFMGLLCSIPGLILEAVLKRKGIIKESRVYIIGGSILTIFCCTMFLPNHPSWIDFVLAIIAPASGAFRGDLWMTFRKGRWWWLQ